MIILGIDPGSGGGIAFKDTTTGECKAINMPETQPDIYNSIKYIAKMGPCKCYIEKVHAMPGEGVNSVWTFSGNFHGLTMALYALQVPFTLVTPQTWQKAIGVKKRPVPKANKEMSIYEKESLKKLKYNAKKDHKNNLKEKAQQLFPEQKITLKTADALLLVEYGRLEERV